MQGLYIHIPFCKNICSYCDFFKRIATNKDMTEKYVKTLILELKTHDLSKIDTIYIGGGTPNSLDLDVLEQLLSYINSLNLNIKEYTIELNLKFITDDLIKLLKKYNITRLSIGVETLNNKLYEVINRYESYNDLKSKLIKLNKNGFNNINLDFIFAIPNQTFKDLKKDLRSIKKLKKYITHISYYNLILEDKSILKHQIVNNKYKMLNPDLEAKYYLYIISYLKKLKFYQYEVSSFSKKNYNSIHNLKYWNLENYIGVGSGASGFIFNKRYDKIKNVTKYIDNFKLQNELILSNEELLKEYIFLGLRKINGININKINELFKIDFLNKYPFVLFYVKNKFMKINKNFDLFFTKKGLLVENQILEKFI